MKLQDIFNQLSAGEFSQLSIGKGVDGSIEESKWPTVVSHITLGLTALYRRFNLKEGRITIALQPNITQYRLNSEYSLSNIRSSQTVKYIQDIGNPFKDDLIKIEQVFTDKGFELALNDPSDVYSLLVPNSTTLVVPKTMLDAGQSIPDWLKTETLEVVYRANHPSLGTSGGYLDPERIPIELPITHLQALLYFVASRAHNPIGMSKEFHAGNNWYAKYENECQQLRIDNVGMDVNNSGTKFQRNGWV